MINKLFRNSLGVIKEINSYFLNIEEVVGVDIYDIAPLKINLNLFISTTISIFSGSDPVRVALRWIAKDIRSLSSQSERDFNPITDKSWHQNGLENHASVRAGYCAFWSPPPKISLLATKKSHNTRLSDKNNLLIYTFAVDRNFFFLQFMGCV